MFAITPRKKPRIFNLALKRTAWFSSQRPLQLYRTWPFFPCHSGLCPAPQRPAPSHLGTSSPPSLTPTTHSFIWPVNSSSRKPSLTTATQTILAVLFTLPWAPYISTLFYSLYLLLISLSTPSALRLWALRAGMLFVLSILVLVPCLLADSGGKICKN